MNWNNINLNSPYETSQEILDGYSTDTLLLEVHCNLREINKETVRAHFLESINSKIQTAKEIFEANIDNIVQKAIEDRNKD